MEDRSAKKAEDLSTKGGSDYGEEREELAEEVEDRSAKKADRAWTIVDGFLPEEATWPTR